MNLKNENKVLITGAAGFIGFHVAQEAARNGYDVTAFDGLLGGLYPVEEKAERWAKLDETPEISKWEGDLRTVDWSAVENQFDYVINLAAMPGLSLSWSDFELYEGCNFTGVARLLRAAQSWSVKRFIQVSTSSVYGLNAVGAEDNALEPVSPYGVTKLAAEKLLMAYFRSHKFPVSILRYFSVYGPGQRPDMAYRRFIDSAIRGEPLTLRGDESQSRTNTFVSDVAEATVRALQDAQPGEIYNISGTQETTIANAIQLILELTGSSSEVVHLERIPGDQDRTSGDSSKAARDIGFRPTTLLRDGIATEIEYLASR
jgi:nucleoside-diphosphate-sugar epimerase